MCTLTTAARDLTLSLLLDPRALAAGGLLAPG
jgi:hypothetical protein